MSDNTITNESITTEQDNWRKEKAHWQMLVDQAVRFGGRLRYLENTDKGHIYKKAVARYMRRYRILNIISQLELDPVKPSTTANEYQERARRTLRPAQALTPEQGLMLNMTLGLAGEAGEVVELVKKAIFHGHHFSVVNVAEELGDILYYVAMIADLINVNLETVMKDNQAKREARYPNGFSEERSQQRDN